MYEIFPLPCVGLQESIFIVAEHSGNKNHFATSIHGELFLRFMMTEKSAIEPLIAFPLLATVVGNIVSLSTHERASVNLCEMISVSSTSFNLALVRGINEHLAFIYLQNEVSLLAVEYLKGRLMLLSTVPYARFVVQAIFKICVEKTVCDCYNELVLDDLVTHSVGHFVHQSVIRRLETIDIMLCWKLCNEIISRKRDYFVTHYAAKNIQFTRLIRGDLFMRLMRICDDVKPLFAFVTTVKVSFQVLQPLLCTISNNILILSKNEKASENLVDIIFVASLEFNLYLVKGITQHK
ncbi:Armadillo-like helical protein [Raphanus sativus]|nr:Armadillo-like helical protein [Raphanus sativus]